MILSNILDKFINFKYFLLLVIFPRYDDNILISGLHTMLIDITTKTIKLSLIFSRILVILLTIILNIKNKIDINIKTYIIVFNILILL